MLPSLNIWFELWLKNLKLLLNTKFYIWTLKLLTKSVSIPIFKIEIKNQNETKIVHL